jgi:hypothetical protein
MVAQWMRWESLESSAGAKLNCAGIERASRQSRAASLMREGQQLLGFEVPSRLCVDVAARFARYTQLITGCTSRNADVYP